MNQNGENIMNLCESSILEINTKSYFLCMYVLHMIVKARTFESTNHIKIKITCHHRVMEDACICFGKQYHSWMLAESVSQCSIKF